ncbi:YHYH protein [Undibacterium sp. LX40W]|uniref:YHYH protein n=1 Tax=Undibacterium nitidum TaxID=2762298 RepID=A0A923KVP6_9BURK|nr:MULTISPECIES: YHYH protein [Undibacterium]MBC3883352.1 YHYH protein [Undibacterium nitidum]MBC3893634.1 YHYH protein [Undibacterium sp. LX40W]
MKKNYFKLVLCLLCAIPVLTACGGTEQSVSTATIALAPAPASVTNTANFPAPRANYALTKMGNQITVTDLVGSTGSQTLTDASKLNFADMSINLRVGDIAQKMSEANLQSLIELYIAFFNRSPDADGLAYWMETMQAGGSLERIAESFYEAGKLYPQLTGYSETMNPQEFIRVVYKNVLGRTGSTAPTDSEVNYWANEVSAGRFTKASVINAMLVSARTFAKDPEYGWVTTLLNNKVNIGRYLSVEQGISYLNDSDNISKSMAVIAAITKDDTSKALSLVGLGQDDFSLLPSRTDIPKIIALGKGDGVLSVLFDASLAANNSGSVYVINCSAAGKTVSASGSSSLIRVTGLVNGVAYACTLNSRSGTILGTASVPAIGTPTAFSSLVEFKGNVVLGAPTNEAVIANVLSPTENWNVIVSYGRISGTYEKKTSIRNLLAGVPTEINLEGLAADSAYFYRLHLLNSSNVEIGTTSESRFHTARSIGSSFSFTIQGDSHPERPSEFSSSLYTRTLQTAAADQADFHITLGDDFSVDTLDPATVTKAQVVERYTLQRPYLGLIGRSSPVFLVNGNHEQSAGYLLNGTENNVAVWAQNARNMYYTQPAPNNFYSGNTQFLPFIGQPRNYYSWTWGDALFVAIDPYLPSTVPLATIFGNTPLNTDIWAVTHGDAQYQWLKATLEQSKAKYKFVFAHHVMGANRGGVEVANLAEWGGYNKNGVNEFAQKRPTWSLPIHQLMVANKVTAFFQGHDHVWVRQQLDGVTYQTLSEPANPNYNFSEFSSSFLSGDKFPNSGYTRVNVSTSGVKVDYVRTYLPADEGVGKTNGSVAFSYTIAPVSVVSGTSSTQGVGCNLSYSGFNSSTRVNANSIYNWSCSDSKRILSGNDIPDHAVTTGNFATPMSAQNINVTMPIAPVLATKTPTTIIGYANNSVKFDPATAGSCSSTATSTANNGGCVMVGGSGPWILEAIGGAFVFGTDESNAHVQPNGQYHYHGMPEGILNKLNKGTAMSLVGFAVDGFPIYARYGYINSNDSNSGIKVLASSYRKKSTPDAGRPSTNIFPMGTFTPDYEYVSGLGDLDECNGRFGVTPEFPKGIYYYMITDSFPYIQRCTKGAK